MNVTFDSQSAGAKSFASNPDFYDIDEVRIEGVDIFIYIDNFAFAPALIPVDSDPPLVTGISPVGAPLTTATSVNFSVSFSKTAKNVSSDDFVLTTAGTAGTIGSVSGSGSSYTVAVTGISGEGTIRLDLKSGTNIANEDDIQGTPAFTSGQPHTVSACFVETFETETDASTSFSGNGANFSLGTGLEIEKRGGFGAGHSGGFVINNNTAGSFSLTSATEFTMSTVDLFLSDQTNGDNPTANGTIVITGKKGGADQFTISKSTGFPTSTVSNGGFFTINFATDGAGNYRNINVDELVFTLSGGFTQLAIDNFNFCKAVSLVDTQAPVVQSISKTGSPLSTSSGVNFQVLFNENATNVTLDDFTLIRTGTVTGALTSISGSGFNYTLGVTGISGEGSIQVKLNAGTNIQDALGNTPPFEFLNGQIHLVGACYIETFESLINGATSFSSNGKAFTIGGNWAVKDRTGFGIGPSSKFLENTGSGTYTIAVDAPVQFSKLALFLTSNTGGAPSPTSDGTVTIRGKDGATTAYTITKTTGFPTDFSSNQGYFYIDFSTEGGVDNSETYVDGLEIEIGGSFIYLALDNLEFCSDFEAPSGYTVAIDQAQIDDANAAAASFTFADAEVGATYDYTFSSDGGGTDVTGSGTVATLTDQITSINLSGLGGGTVTLSVTLTDPSGNTGAVATDTKQRIVNAAPVATAPTAPSVSEDTSADLPDDIEITDGESDDQSVTFTITGGTLSLGTTGVTFGGGGNGSASFTASGTLAAINTALDAATFTPIANLFGTGVATIAFVSNDGTVDSNTASGTFDIAGVNDDPTFGGIINSITVVEDEYPAYLRDALSSGLFQDIDAGLSDVSLTIATSQGVIGISNPAGYGVSQSGHNTPTLILTGPAANIESFLNIDTNAALILPNNLSGPNAITITLTANDKGNTGDGGGNDVVVGTVNVNITPVNDAPTVANLIPNQNASEDAAFNFQFAANTFEDVDLGNTLTYTAELVGGGALPGWLSFDAATRTFSGTPTNGDVGTVSIKVTAADGNGESVFDEFDIVVANVNSAPTVANPIPNQSATEDIAFSFQFAVSTFEDADAGTTLTYTAGLDGGGLLPAWLSFDGLTRTFSGTPTNANVETVSITVTADDGNLGTISDSFDIVVANVNDAPTVANPIPNQNATEDMAFNFQFAANTFEDVDLGSTLVYTAELAGGGALPVWLSFDAATRTFSGTPTNANVGTVSVNVSADDGNVGTISDSFDIAVAAINDAPVNSIPGSQVTGQNTSLVFNGGGGNQISISDVDAGASSVRLTLTATNGTLTLSGTVGLVFNIGDGTSDASMGMEGSISDVNNALNGLTFSPTSGYYGAAAVQISTNDLGNTGSGGPLTDTDEIQVTVNSINPVVTGVSSTTANGTYGVDSPIVVAVTFNQNILVNTAGGTPRLLLETGSTDREATYTSGSGTETLLFAYTVVAGDVSADLDYQSTSALSLNGATLRNIPGNNATLTLPNPGAAGSLGANKALVIDAVKPSGYSVLIDQDPIITTNQTAVSFTFAGAEVGATFNYSFSSSGGGTSVSGSGTVASMTQQVAGIDLTSLAIGTITLSASLTDPTGNIGDEVSDTSQKLAPITAAITAQTDVACNGDNTGSLTVEVSGGMANYTYSWSNGTIVAGTSSSTNDLTSLIAGGYSVTVTDENGQIAMASATITEPSALLIAIGSQTDVSCFGGSDGSATISVSGGTGEYSYSWAPSGGDAATALGLTVGMYTVTVTDANGCSASQSFDISQPTALVASTSQIDAVCGVGGSASVTPSGGAGGYTYLWSSGSTSSIATGLAAGNHSVLITDMNGCELTKNFTIGGAFTLNATTSQSDVSCFGGNDGSATVTVQEGIGPFDYQWTGGGGTGATATGLAAGPYSVTVTDANGCSKILNVTITQPATASLTTAAVTGVTFSGATLGGTISTSEVGCASETGVVYSTSPGPDLTDSKEVMTITGGEFSEVISGLALTTTYYAKAYSTNSNGITVYGNEVSFTTSDLTVLNVTADAQSKVFGQADPALTYTYSGLNPGDDISSVLTGALSREIGEDVGDYAIQQGTLSVIPGSGYSLSYVSADFSITPATVTGVTFTDGSFVYDGTVKSLAIAGTLPAGTSVSYTGNSRTDVGTQEVTAMITGGNYADLVLKADLTVTPATLAIIADTGQTKIYGTVDPMLTYSSTGLVAGDNITGALNRMPGENAGLYAISQGTLSAGSNYTIDFTSADFEITKATLNLTATAGQTKIYGNADPTFAYTATGFENGDTNVILAGALDRTAGESVGAYAIGLGTLSAGANYTISYTGEDFEITPATLNVTANAGQSKAYGSADPIFAYTATGLQNGDTNAVFTGALDRTAGETVGAYAIGLGSLSAGANYTINYTGADFTIGTQLLQVTVTAGQSKVYGNADPVFTYSATGFENGDTNTVLTGSLQRTAGENVGLYAISQGTLSAGSNYTINFTSANFEITKTTLNVTADAGQTKVYGDAEPTLTYTATGFENGDTNTVLTGTIERTSGENVGLYVISQGTLSAGGNYTINFTPADFEITKATLNVTADAGQTKVYGNAEPALTYTATGFQNGDTNSVFSGALNRAAGEGVGAYAIGLGSLSAGANYTINFTGSDFEITARTLQISANPDQAKVYGSADPVFAFTATNFGNGDTESILTGALARETGENIGEYAILIGSLNAGSNYVIDFTSATFTIAAKVLNVTADTGQTKIFGTVDPVFSYAVSGFENGDNASILTGELERASGENVGAYAINLGSLNAGENYAINYIGADFVITKATISGISLTDASFVFDGSAKSLSISGALPTGTSVAYANNSRTNVGTQEVTATITGANYTTLVLTADLTITPATISGIVFADGSFTYDGTAKSLAITGTLPMGTWVAYANNSRTNVGTQEVTVTITGSNYTTLVLTADLTITPATISGITFSDGSFTYDGTAKSLAIAGTLPMETSVDYANNSRTNVGTQEVTATITGSNYTTLVLTADLTITPAAFSGVTFADGSFTYDGTAKSLAIAGTLPMGTSVAYANNSRTNVGTQEVTATITSSNYTTLVLTADLTITPATISGVTFTDGSFTYDGTAKSLAIAGTLPMGTSVGYANNSRTNVGTQEVTATITGANYTTKVLKADLTITPATLTITVGTGQSKLYGTADPELTYTVSGLKGADTESILTGTLSRVPGEEVGSYAITIGTLAAGTNYSIDYTGADFEILTNDTDGDDVPDDVEETQGTDPKDPTDYQDTDVDDVPDYVEEQTGTDPSDPGDYQDTDEDGTPDYVEEQKGTDPNDGTDFPDEDGDGVPDYVQQRAVSEFVTGSLEAVWGTSADDLTVPAEVVAITSKGEFVNLTVTWDLKGYDGMSTGSTTYSGTAEVTEGLFNPYGLQPMLEITVLAKPAPQDVTLSNNSFIAVPDQYFQEIGGFTVIDPTDNIHTLTLVDGAADNGYFEVLDGILFWSSADPAAGRTDFSILLSVTDRAGNELQKSFQITRQRTPLDQLEVPNTFTPNGDGVNDTWGVPGLQYFTGGRVQVFDRGGQRIFYTEKPQERWDGTFEGKEMPAGSYVWIVESRESGEVRRGVLTLLKK
ncbi:MBG domain-containing protein [Algoriphagus terrigena]|uniref:MBG domain-containing protein n=1 Tax=Algoriphagus terrigena TaxID=344884 RepID=UPI00041EE30C|nr:MBG domain-containing protein [Algoriphagus terrigena]